MQILLAAESDPTDYDVQLLKSSISLPKFDLLPHSIHPSEGDMMRQKINSSPSSSIVSSRNDQQIWCLYLKQYSWVNHEVEQLI
jgi:hypothetical protein